jgi:hypothetical protein
MPTLFVVGIQEQEWIGHHLNGRGHIYFGANQSFPNPHVNDAEAWKPWEDMIRGFLDRDYLCTLDVDVRCVEGLSESGLCDYVNFIPMISVKMPYIRQLGYNATLKLDDRDFADTNPGVWCHSLHNLMSRATFTSWNNYREDSVI